MRLWQGRLLDFPAAVQEYRLTVWGRFCHGFPVCVRAFIAKALAVEGRASRSEFWYAVLFQVLVSLAVQVLMGVPLLGFVIALVGGLVLIAMIIPRHHGRRAPPARQSAAPAGDCFLVLRAGERHADPCSMAVQPGNARAEPIWRGPARHAAAGDHRRGEAHPPETPTFSINFATSSTPLPWRTEPYKGRCPQHALVVALHDRRSAPNHRGKIGLVDAPAVRAGDAPARPCVGFISLAPIHIDHINGDVGRIRRKVRGEIVAARIDQHDVDLGNCLFIVAMAARISEQSSGSPCADSPRLPAHDPALRRQRAATVKEARVLLGVDVIGDRAMS